MFARLKTPQEAYNPKLGAALKMERTVLETLEDNEKSAQDALRKVAAVSPKQPA
jgi:hypothetical protein